MKKNTIKRYFMLLCLLILLSVNFSYAKINTPITTDVDANGNYSRFIQLFTISIFFIVLLFYLNYRAHKNNRIQQSLTQELKKSQERFYELEKQSRSYTWEFDEEGCMTYVSPGILNVLGYRPEDIIKKTHVADRMPAENKETIKELAMSLLKNNQPLYNYENKQLHSNGKILWFLTNGVPVQNEEGKPIAYRGVDIDITDQMHIQMALTQSEARLKTIISVSNLGAWEFNANTHLFWASPEYFTLLGYNRNDFPETGQFPGPFKDAIDALIHPDDFQSAQDVLKNCLESIEDIPYDSYFRMKRADGRYAWIRSRGRRLKNTDGSLSHILVGTHLDVSDLKAVENKIKKISYQDKLTHLYNRRYYEEHSVFIDQEINLPISLIMIDANGLKLINDAFGHLAGDELLVKSSEVLREIFRKSDLIVRVGGDEFVVLLPNTEEQMALELVKRIENALEKVSVRDIPITLSFGVATKVENTTLLEDVYRKAENNMYQSKIKTRDENRQNSIKIIMETLFYKYPKEKEHAEKISALSSKIAEHLGLEESMVEQVKAIGFFHDIGKIGIREEVLLDISHSSEDTIKEFKRHTEVGYNIISSTNAYAAYAKAILHHHENFDGSGYPRGLVGDEIPFFSRILQVAHALENPSTRDVQLLDPKIWAVIKDKKIKI